MMNIGNLGSQERVGVKYNIVSICTIFLKNCDLKATGIFLILLSRDGFKCNSETRLQTILVKSVQKQPYANVFKTGALKNFTRAFSKFLRTAFI